MLVSWDVAKLYLQLSQSERSPLCRQMSGRTRWRFSSLSSASLTGAPILDTCNSCALDGPSIASSQPKNACLLDREMDGWLERCLLWKEASRRTSCDGGEMGLLDESFPCCFLPWALSRLLLVVRAGKSSDRLMQLEQNTDCYHLIEIMGQAIDLLLQLPNYVGTKSLMHCQCIIAGE
jgi:hypothetical protein